jgi:uroporphyrinogen-III synthase
MRDRPIILLTRPQDGSKRFAERIVDRFGDAVEVVLSPLQRIEWVDFATPRGRPKGLIFTSQNGVLASIRVDSLKGLPAYCVGLQTTGAAAAAGYQAMECGGDAEAVIATILDQQPEGPLLHIRGEHGRGRIAERLAEAGVSADECIAYRQVSEPMPDVAEKLLKGDRPVFAPLFSPRSAKLFVQALPKGAAPWVAVISPNAAEPLDDMLRRRMIVADTPDAQGMMDAIAGLLAASKQT